jgi:hypothetical protein
MMTIRIPEGLDQAVRDVPRAICDYIEGTRERDEQR